MTDKTNPFKEGDRVKHLYGEFGTVAAVNGKGQVFIDWYYRGAKLSSVQHFSNLHFADDTFKANGVVSSEVA